MKKLIAVLAAAGLVFGLAACEDPKETDRQKAQKASQSQGETLEIKNLKEKKRREEAASAIRYLYVVSFGKPMGYYITKGKISSNGSQIGPELDLINQNCSGCSDVPVDSAQDDGSYGDGDPGIFFFTTDGTMVVTSLDYIQSDQPLAFNVPQLLK